MKFIVYSLVISGSSVPTFSLIQPMLRTWWPFDCETPAKPGHSKVKMSTSGRSRHDLLRHRLDVVADQRRRAGGVDEHALDLGHFVEGFVDRLFEALLAAEHDVAFLHVGRPHIFHVEVAVVGRIALGVPGVVGAADRAVDHLDRVFQHAADDELGAAEGAAALRERAGNGRRVGDRQEVARILAVHLQIDVLFPFGNGLVAFKQNHRHR